MLVRIGGAFLDGIRDFVGLAVTDPDLAFTVTDDGESRERKTATAFDDFGTAIDENHLLDHGWTVTLLGLVAIVPSWTTITTGTTITARAALATETAATTLAARSALFASWCSGGSRW
jgi:hypothetical protein